ncbi:MAG: hypothetical protein LBQ86_08695 [Holophagales bacterium]|nr:hypothetical protein [Holophagales bacterium]
MDMTPEQAVEAAKGMTFEKVWLYMQETQKQFREVQQEISNLSKNIGGLNNSIGKITEAMFLPEIHTKFITFGYNFNVSSTSTNRIFRDEGQAIAEADIYLENGSISMIVEVKTELTRTDIDEHIERIEIIKSYFNKYNNNRNILGAVAGTIINSNIIKYAHKNGLFVLVQSGESVKIADMPENFKPRTW